MARLAARTTALIAAVLVLAGCASTRTVWSRDGASDMDFRRDRYECGREDTWAAGGSGLPGALAVAEAKAEAERGWRECMEIRGWIPREVED
jgi:hypothetical protein